MVNKTGFASLLVGAIVLAATWYFAFFKSGAVAFGQSIIDLVLKGLVVGGLAWLGIFLVVLGVLILVI